MYLVPSLLYLATLGLAFSILPRPLSGHSLRPAHAHARLRSHTASPTSSATTALPSSPNGSEIPDANEQSGSSTSSVPSSSTVSSSSTPSPSPPSPSPSTPVPSPVSQQTQQDMDTVLQRRLGFITASATGASKIASWYVTHPVSLLVHI